MPDLQQPQPFSPEAPAVYKQPQQEPPKSTQYENGNDNSNNNQQPQYEAPQQNQYGEVRPVYQQSVEYDPGHQTPPQYQQPQQPAQQTDYNTEPVSGGNNGGAYNSPQQIDQQQASLKYGQRLRPSSDTTVIYGQAEPLDVKIVSSSQSVVYDGQSSGNRLYLEPSNQEVRIQDAGNR